jgi:primosomal protein N''
MATAAQKAAFQKMLAAKNSKKPTAKPTVKKGKPTAKKAQHMMEKGKDMMMQGKQMMMDAKEMQAMMKKEGM